MKIKFCYHSEGELWHGFHFTKHAGWYDFGLIAFDVYEALGFSELYFWRFSVQFFHKKKKVPHAPPSRNKPRNHQAEENREAP